MSLEFLSTRAGARSPLTGETTAAGAQFVEYDGWHVAARYADPDSERTACTEQVGWADCSHVRKLELQGTPEQIESARPARGRWLEVTPERVLLLGAQPDPEGRALVLDVTSQLGALMIMGPLARELFARFCALDLRPHIATPGTFLAGSVARTPGYVLCEAPQRYIMLFGAAYAQYIWQVLADAGEHLGGRPVGLETLRSCGVALDA